MSNTTEEKTQFADYCGHSVIVEDIYVCKNEGTLAAISFDDGREDIVPYSTLNLVD